MAMKFICAVLLVILATLQNGHCAEIERTSVLKLKDGQVRGIVQNLDGGKKIHLYQGIRYGHANRFEKARPAEPWSNVYEASTNRDACYQFGFRPVAGQPQINTFSEDCLYLSVFRPAVEAPRNRSVMVYIHAGGFEIGSIFSGILDPGYFAHDGDVIVVPINYRLGPLGFLSGGQVPGNMGLHDQILALKWVQENIHYFGGDKNKVTIFGHSAGSISVGSLLISPLAKGLFNRAILQSGAPTSPFAKSKSTLLETTKMFAQKLHCPVEPIEHAIDCVKNKSIAQLQNASYGDFHLKQPFIPLYGDELMPLKPSEALKTGKFHQVDLLFGVTRDEGSIFTEIIDPILNKTIVLTVATIKQDIVDLMKHYGVQNGQNVANFYTFNLQNATRTEQTFALSRVLGDYNLICPTILFGEEFAKSSTNASHFYSYRMMQELTLLVLLPHQWNSVLHGIDALYLFGSFIKVSPVLNQLNQDMILAWAKFAKTGNPEKLGSVQWEGAFSSASLAERQPITRSMHIEASEYKMTDNAFKQNCDSLWKPKLFN